MDKTKPKTSSSSGGAAKIQQASSGSRGAQGRINVRMVQNVLLIWLDSNIDTNNADCTNTLTQLRRAVNNVNTFTDGDQCVQFLEDIAKEKACMIISGSLGQHVVPRVHDMSQVDSIFIFCGNKKYHREWVKQWPKIKGVFTDIKLICEALKQAAQHCEHNAVSISFMATSTDDASPQNLDRLDPSFMYTQILKETLLTIDFEPKHFKEFIDHSRQHFHDDDTELHNIRQLERKYRHKTPIWWYTFECFLYPMLNRALRTMDANVIVEMGFFVKDLHNHIEQLHTDQFAGRDSDDTFTVYRGQGLPKADFDQLVKTKGGLMAFNNFLSTSKDRNVSLGFARSNLTDSNMVGVLFVMTIDPSQSTTPFASITEVSYYEDKEDEVLFSMHSIFRIRKIKSMSENNRLYQVDLTLTSDNDKDLRVLTERIRDEIGGTGWYRLGELLRKMGQFDKAEEVYQVLLDQTTDESKKGDFYHQLALQKYNQGEYPEALKLYEKSLEIYRKTLPPNHLSLASSYNNIGGVYDSMGDYPKALSNHEKALAIKQQSLPPNHPDLGASYNNIGGVYYSMGDYPKALSNYEKALAISKQSLPPNHPSLGMSYNNIGLVYDKMGDYPKALSNHEKALAIRQQSLPPNHPDLGASYNNIGMVYDSMGDYPKALSNYEKALAIQQQSLPPNHPSLGRSYNNIGVVYRKMGDYPKALSNYEKALAIKQQSLPPNHPSLASSYNNIGVVYENMKDYKKAHSFYERAVKNAQQSLPVNHPRRLQWQKNLEDIKKKL